MKIESKVEKGMLSIDLYQAIGCLSDEEKQKFLEWFVFDEVIKAIELQLKRGTENYWWSTDGECDGSRLRKAILKINGIEPEFKVDLEKRIQALEREVKHYKKYYDFYFKIYHCRQDDGFSLMAQVNRMIGDVEK